MRVELCVRGSQHGAGDERLQEIMVARSPLVRA
jgi:hypothetical protein